MHLLRAMVWEVHGENLVEMCTWKSPEVVDRAILLSTGLWFGLVWEVLDRK